jgi:hypothetical protein
MPISTRFQPPPSLLSSLLTDPSYPNGKHFRSNMQRYNTAFTMLSSPISSLAANPEGYSLLAIRGRMFHKVGPASAAPGSAPKFAQLYLIENAQEQAEARLAALGQAAVDVIRPPLLLELQRMMMDHNANVRKFRTAMDIPPQEVAQYRIVFKLDGTIDKRRYNAPVADEVAGFLPGAGALQPGEFQVLARAETQPPDPRNPNQTTFIDDRSPYYDALRFPLLHPNGELGWHGGIMNSNNTKRISLLQDAVFWLNDRGPGAAAWNNCLLLKSGRLLQEWAIDQYTRCVCTAATLSPHLRLL